MREDGFHRVSPFTQVFRKGFPLYSVVNELGADYVADGLGAAAAFAPFTRFVFELSLLSSKAAA